MAISSQIPRAGKNGRYEIGKLLSTDGFTSVFCAFDTKENKTVAVKMMNKEFPQGTAPELIRAAGERLDTEIRVLSELEHPNVLGMLRGSDENASLRFLLTEYGEGITLAQYIAGMPKHRLPFNEIVAFSEQILAALVHIHQNGIMHLDIRPENIIVRKNGYIKLANFGWAQTIPPKHERRVAAEHLPEETLPYAAPEFSSGNYIDEKADLYAFGSVLYEMTTGRTPYNGLEAASVDGKPILPSKLRRDTPKQLEEIIMYLLDRNPKKRYDSALDTFREVRRLRIKPLAIVSIKSPEQLVTKHRNDKNHAENPPSKALTPVIFGIAVAIFLVAIVSLFYSLDSLNLTGSEVRSVKVPAVVGEDFYTERALGFNEDYDVTVRYEYSLTVEKGKVMSQNPPAGSSRKVPCSISIVVSRGPQMVTIADYTVRDWRLVRAELRELGFVVSIEDVIDPYVPYGYIISTVPPASSEVLLGSTIKLYVSAGSGHRQVAAPSFIGLSENQAVELLKEASLYIGNVTYTRSAEPVGTVIAQFPEAGTPIFTGSDNDSIIDFVVSGGSRYSTNFCPDILGLSVAEATERLAVFGLKTQIRYVTNKAEKGTILAQTPENGGILPASTTIVILTVSGGPDYVPAVPTMPFITGIPFSDALSIVDHYLTPDGITFGIEVQYIENEADYGTVLSQFPVAGKTIAGHVSIELIVSGGPNFMPNFITVTVPSVTGFSLSGARTILENNGIKIENLTYEASYQPTGTVLRQSVQSNTKLTGREGTIYIDIVVSGGPNYTP